MVIHNYPLKYFFWREKVIAVTLNKEIELKIERGLKKATGVWPSNQEPDNDNLLVVRTTSR